MKRIISFIMSIALLACFTCNAYATSCDETLYTYKTINDEEVTYFLDEQGNPYTVENGQRLYLALALPSLKVTDDEIVAKLNEELYAKSVLRSPIPTNTVHLGNSPAYSMFCDFSNGSAYRTPIFDFDMSYPVINIKTTDIVKPLLAGKKVDIIYFYYSTIDNTWYNVKYSQITCTDVNGFSIKNFSNVYPYGAIYIDRYSNITSLTLNVWLSAYYS